MMVGAHHDAARAAFGDHRARVGERQRQRLLAQHMLARLGRGEAPGRDAARWWSRYRRRRRRAVDQRLKLVVARAMSCSCA